MGNNELTAKQEKIFIAVDSYIKDKVISPTRKELAEITGEKSVNGVNQKLNQLQAKGYLKIHPPGKKRNITILKWPYSQKELFD